MNTAIKIDKLTFRWPKQKEDLLDIPSFEISCGEQIFLAGPSGSGKSTLLNLIAGILTPRSGSIRIGDVTISDLPGYRRDLYRVSHIGFIFQQFNLIPYLSIEENVLLPCLLCSGREQNEQGSVKQRVKQLLSELDLPEDSWGKKVRQLSIGQQQRVAAARALIGRPELIVADEPTSALDYDRRISFLDVLMKQCRQQNTTLLFVSHDLNLAPQFSRTVDLNEINHAGYHG